MRGVNRVTLVGNVGSDPDVRTTSSGTMVAKVSLATNRTYKDKAGEKQEDTQWHRLTFWSRLAEIVDQYVTKGDRLYVEGRIEYSTTTSDDGWTRYWTDIHVDELVMLGSLDAERGKDGARGERPDAAALTAPAQSPRAAVLADNMEE